MRLVGVLMGFSEQAGQSLVTTFRGALRTLGWIEGTNLKIELRWGAGDASRIGTFAKELVDLQPAAILAQTTPVAVAIAHETTTIPIVFVTVSDPIGSGLATSVTHPGGNITGFTFVESANGRQMGGVVERNSPANSAHGAIVQPGNSSTAAILRAFYSSCRFLLCRQGEHRPSTTTRRKSNPLLPDRQAVMYQSQQGADAGSKAAKPLHATLARRTLLRLDPMAAPHPRPLGVPQPELPRLRPTRLPRDPLQTILRWVLATTC